MWDSRHRRGTHKVTRGRWDQLCGMRATRCGARAKRPLPSMRVHMVAAWCLQVDETHPPPNAIAEVILHVPFIAHVYTCAVPPTGQHLAQHQCGPPCACDAQSVMFDPVALAFFLSHSHENYSTPLSLVAMKRARLEVQRSHDVLLGILHMQHCSNGNGDHDDEWRRHAHDHGRQLIGVLADGDVARCFKNKNEVTEHQATTRTKTRRARESVNLAM